MKDAYTTNEIADAFEVSVKNAIKRARREGWQSRPRAGRPIACENALDEHYNAVENGLYTSESV